MDASGKRDEAPGAASGTTCSRAARATGCATTRRCARRCVRTCPRSSPAGDVINDGARTVRVPVRHARALPLPAARSRGATGRRPGQGQARRRVLRSEPTAGPGQKGAGGRDDGGVQLLLEFKIDDIVDWLWEEMQLPNLKARAGPSDESDWMREGWDRRGARSRLDRRRSFKEAGQAPRHSGRDARLHRRGPALPAAGAAPAAGGARGGVLHARCLRQHVRPRPQARQDLLLLGGAGPAARVPLARDGVRRAHHRGVGVQRAGFLPGQRHRRHRRLHRV